MEKQEYTNHIRYYSWHHFILYPVLMIATAMCFYQVYLQAPTQYLWAMLGFMFICLGLFSLMVRQHYALLNQDRIVRLEMRLRYYILTQDRLERQENKLSLKQLAALRFAGDEELVSLLKLTIRENLPPDKIKQRITNWQPDNMRV